MRWQWVIYFACMFGGPWLWVFRPQHRARALYLWGIASTIAASNVKTRDVMSSIALSVLAITLFLSALWLQQRERKRGPGGPAAQ